MKRMFENCCKLIFCLAVSFSLGFSDSKNTTTSTNSEFQSEKEILEKTLFPEKDSVVETPTCQFSCRKVIDGYQTMITNINAGSGTTFCSVFSVYDLNKSIGISASQTNKTCRKQANPTTSNKNLSSVNSEYKYSSYDSLKKDQNNAFTFSRFLASMVTLDPEIIDFGATKNTGIFTLKNPSIFYGTNISYTNNDRSFFEKLKTLMGSSQEDPQLVSAVDSINKSNLAYYANLFASINNNYNQLQYIVFIFVGAYFLGGIGLKSALNYVEKNQSREGYLKQFAIPVMAASFFFVPIPESGGMSSTIVQNFIRFTTAKSVWVADRISKQGMIVYMQKIYSSVGSQEARGEKQIRNSYLRANAQAQMYSQVLNYCKNSYPNRMSFTKGNKELEKYYGDDTLDYDLNNQANSKKAITLGGCARVERSWLETKTQARQYKHYIDVIEKSYKDKGLQALLYNLNVGINDRQADLGWVNAIILPSTSVMVEMLSTIKENQIQDTESDSEKIEAARPTNEHQNSSWLSDTGDIVGNVIGNVAWFLMPGSGSVYQFINTAIDKGSIVTKAMNLLFPIGGSVATVIYKAGTPIASLYATAYIFEKILDFLPVIVATIAGIIAFISYIVELAKYYYVSPFVVAFSLTTRNIHKIADFLVTGIAVFMKPILIVLFIFLSLFMFSLVKDIFLYLSIIQFDILEQLNNEFFVAILLGIVKVLLKILASIASVWIMWKIILSGPSWVMRMVGVDDKGGPITDALTHKLERYSFQL